MTRAFDSQGRQIVSLARTERWWFGIALTALLAALGWGGLQLMDMRDSVRTLGTFRAQDRHDLDDHEIRLRTIERPHP